MRYHPWTLYALPLPSPTSLRPSCYVRSLCSFSPCPLAWHMPEPCCRTRPADEGPGGQASCRSADLVNPPFRTWKWLSLEMLDRRRTCDYCWCTMEPHATLSTFSTGNERRKCGG